MNIKVELQELVNFIKKRLDNGELLILHVYDFEKRNNIFDLSIEPKVNALITYHELEMAPKKPYDVLYEALMEISPTHTRVLTNCGKIYGEYSVQLMIHRNIWIIFDYSMFEGEKWMEKIYKERNYKN